MFRLEFTTGEGAEKGQAAGTLSEHGSCGMARRQMSFRRRRYSGYAGLGSHAMLFASLSASMNARRSRWRRYRRLRWEIENMSGRELADICGDRDNMLSDAYPQVYGTERPSTYSRLGQAGSSSR